MYDATPSFVLWLGCGKVRSDAATRRYLHHLIRHQERSEQLGFQSAAVTEQKMRTVDESILDLLFCVQPRDDNLFLLCSHNRRSPVFDQPTSFPLVTPYDSSPREAETPHGRAQRDGFDGESLVERTRQGAQKAKQSLIKNPEILLSFLPSLPSDGRESSITQKTNQRCPFFARSSLVHFVGRAWEVRTLVRAFALLSLLGVLAVPPLILSPSVNDHVD